MQTKNREYIIKEIDNAKNVFLDEEFRVDHPFRTTRLNFGPNVLDTEGERHAIRKRAWSAFFSRKNIKSVQFQNIISDAINDGFNYAIDNKNLFLIAQWMPNKVILDLLNCGDIDPIEHYHNIHPIIFFLEYGYKPNNYNEAKEYIRSDCFYKNKDIFKGLPDKDRENDIALLVGAGVETTVVALEILISKWVKSPTEFSTSLNKLGSDKFVQLLLDNDPPLGLATKYCSKDVVIEGNNLTKGDIVHVSITDTNKQAICPFQAATGFINKIKDFLTFGHGRHHCPGHLLAKEELKLVAEKLCTLNISDFNFTLPDIDRRPNSFRHPTPFSITPKKINYDF
ncbi:cytochrome P450 [Providencia rettgeri]|uniref:cytochrome P450 n=1 Tax=Providencia rettgeri TaxID=587 RepID=UPI0032DB3AF4